MHVSIIQNVSLFCSWNSWFWSQSFVTYHKICRKSQELFLRYRPIFFFFLLFLIQHFQHHWNIFKKYHTYMTIFFLFRWITFMRILTSMNILFCKFPRIYLQYKWMNQEVVWFFTLFWQWRWMNTNSMLKRVLILQNYSTKLCIADEIYCC